MKLLHLSHRLCDPFVSSLMCDLFPCRCASSSFPSVPSLSFILSSVCVSVQPQGFKYLFSRASNNSPEQQRPGAAVESLRACYCCLSISPFPVFVCSVSRLSLCSSGGDTSSSSTGTASPVPNSYDSLEGGSYPGTILISL